MHKITGLYTTVFPSIKEFQDYFAEYEELSVPAEEPFEIQDISPVKFDTSLSPEEKKDELSILKRIVDLLNKILLPLSKDVVLKCKIDARFDYQVGKGLRILSSCPVVFGTAKGPIAGNLTELFEVMMTTARYEMRLYLQQPLILVDFAQKLELFYINGNYLDDDDLDDVDNDDLEDKIYAIIKSHNLALISETHQNSSKPKFKIISKDKASLLDKIDLLIEAQTETFLRIQRHLSFTAETFRKIMASDQEIHVFPHETLEIHYSSNEFFDLKKRFPHVEENSFYQYILCEILFPLGKIINISKNDNTDETIKIKWTETTLIFTSKDSFKLKAVPGNILVDVNRMSELLLKSGVSSFTLEPKLSLTMCNISEQKQKKIEESLLKLSPDNYGRCLEAILTQMSFIGLGFAWKISGEGSYVINIGSSYLRILNVGQPMQFSIGRASGLGLILNLINHSSPELLKSLQEYDEKSFIFLSFKMIHYYCFMEYNTMLRHVKPDVKEFTYNRMLFLISEDKEFEKARSKILESADLVQQMNNITHLTPEQFSELEIEKLPSSLSILMRKLMPLVYEEIQGGPFIQKYLKEFFKGLDEGWLTCFIAHSVET